MPTTRDLDALLSPAIEAAMGEMLVPGAIVHVRAGDAPPLHRAYGHRDLDGTDPITVDDHVRIGSNSNLTFAPDGRETANAIAMAIPAASSPSG